MKSLICTKVMAIVLVGIIMGGLVASAHASRGAISADTVKTNSFKSAFLGPDVWEDDLSPTEIRQQLQEHFAQVIERLESTSTSSLLRALKRAEASAVQPWTKSQRQAALISLATNRQRQIARLRYYMNRGLFPQNEGQSISAVPIFVDRHQTHCAVGFLMHSDGNDSGVASIVETNNLVRVNDVRHGEMIDWIGSSGLTQEEAALIQPQYPISFVTSFEELSTPGATLEQNGFVVSEVTARSRRFDTTIPTPIRGDLNALQAIFEQGKAELEAGNVDDGFYFEQFTGVSFGNESGSPFLSFLDSENLDESLYIGSGFDFFPLVNSAYFGGAAIVEVEYMIRSEQSDFSQIALTTNGEEFNEGPLMLVSQIYDGDTGELLGETQLSATGLEFFFQSVTDSIPVATDFVRIKSYGLTVGDGLCSFFNEFSITPTILGDCNLDGVVDFFDVAPFIEVLASQTFLAQADCDQNGVVDFFDLLTFVEILGV